VIGPSAQLPFPRGRPPASRTLGPAPSFKGFRSTSPAASAVMRANRREGGLAEQVLRSALWRSGLRFRKHVSTLPGRPDVVFDRFRAVVFCDGDFWHGRNWPRLRAQLGRRSNATYWIAKIRTNRARDRLRSEELRSAGWTVLRFWESEVLRDPDKAVKRIMRAIEHNTLC